MQSAILLGVIGGVLAGVGLLARTQRPRKMRNLTDELDTNQSEVSHAKHRPGGDTM